MQEDKFILRGIEVRSQNAYVQLSMRVFFYTSQIITASIIYKY